MNEVDFKYTLCYSILKGGDKMSVGNNIRKRREELNLTQEELAKLLGYKSKSTINKIEAEINDITQSKIEAFANALKTTPSKLMGWDIEENKKIGIKFQRIMDQKEISLDELSKKSGFSKDYIESVLNGEADLEADDFLFSKNIGVKFLSIFLNFDCKELINILYSLNDNGKKELVKRSKELTYIPEYINNDKKNFDDYGDIIYDNTDKI